MRGPLAISFGIHVAILLSAVIVLPDAETMEAPPVESIAVDLVEISEVSESVEQRKVEEAPPEPEEKPKVIVEKEILDINPDSKQGDEIIQAAREPAALQEPEPDPVPDQVEPEPEPTPIEELIEETAEEAPPEPEPEIKEEVKDAEAAPAPPKPRIKPKPPKKVAKKEKKKFEADKVAALLNKIDEESQAPLDRSLEDVLASDQNLRGDGQTLSANELDWLRQRLSRCWRIPAGVQNAKNLVVKVELRFDRQGNVSDEPVVVNWENNPRFKAAARSAVAAVYECQPYTKLPAEKYENWKHLVVSFDPRLLLSLN